MKKKIIVFRRMIIIVFFSVRGHYNDQMRIHNDSRRDDDKQEIRDHHTVPTQLIMRDNRSGKNRRALLTLSAFYGVVTDRLATDIRKGLIVCHH